MSETNTLYEAERLTREFATNIEGVINDRLLDEWDKISDFLTDEYLRALEKRISEASMEGLGRVSKLHRIESEIASITTKISKELIKCYEKNGSSCRPESESIEFLQRIEDIVRENTGRGCIHGTSSLPVFVTSLSSCIHVLADYLAEMKKVGKKCLINGKLFNEKLKLACEAWDNLTEKLNDLGLYAGEDYNNLEGRVVDDELILRVGSAPGHATHIDLRKGTLEYYDNDVDVNEAMKDYLEKYAGLSCNSHESGVDCEGVNEDNVVKAAKVLSFATSKDLRFRNPEQYYLGNTELLDFLEKQGIEIPIPKEQIQEVRKALKEYIDAVEEALKYAPTKFKPKLEELAKDIEDVLAEVNKKIKELESSK